jgi:RNA polymerase subunit RPABC4/transcription elongation factor Spt4
MSYTYANLSRLDKLPISIKITFPSSSLNIKNSFALLSASTVPTIARSFITLSLQPPYSLYEFIATGTSYFAQNFGGFVALLATIGGAIYGLWKGILKKRYSKENIETDSENSKKKLCRYCGNVISSLGVYCAFCGKRFDDPFTPTSVLEENNMVQCIRCRSYMNRDSIFCPKCGLKIQR